jgi:EAL domain-containing protein (putative c-di-GMP-specific phosphodiesterase class I)/GGDEF domain-containing protein
MLYPEAKERENRFKLALRMGLPVFALAAITTASVLLRYFNTIPYVFIIVAFSVLGIMVYYLFYLIYQGFNERITDPISHAFTREYFMSLMQKELKKRDYTFMLMSVINLDDINQRYGFANGDKILYNIANRFADYLSERKLTRVPIGHFKGGDFIVALEGTQDQYRSLMDVMCVKFQHHSLEDIEIDIVGSMTDSTRTKSPEKIIEWLYELQSENQKMLHESEEEEVDPDTIERLVIDAVEARSFSYRYQAAYQDDKPVLYEMAVKLVSAEGKLVHQKRFMPVINRLGLLRQFDEIQTEAALKEVPLLEEGQKIAVNVSPSSLRNPLFFEQIMLRMSNNDRLKDRLVFIISENNYFHQVRQFNTRLQAFRRTGIYIALDRLGGQHSSMRYLHDLEVDIVRFESYLGKTITDPKIEALLEGLQHTVKALGYQSWIRMIEDEEQYEAAKKMGIDIKQGRYLSPIDTI